MVVLSSDSTSSHHKNTSHPHSNSNNTNNLTRQRMSLSNQPPPPTTTTTSSSSPPPSITHHDENFDTDTPYNNNNNSRWREELEDDDSTHSQTWLLNQSPSPFPASNGLEESYSGGGNGSSSSMEFSWKNFWRFSGPGWLMSIAYLDPGNLESNLQAAALCGNRLLWILFWAHLLGLLIQNLSSRLGAVTGKHLAQHIKSRYPWSISTALWLMCELAIIGSDIQEVIGTAIALNILFGFSLWVGVLVTAADTFTFLALHRFGMRKLEGFFVSLIGIMALCFWLEMFLVDAEPLPVLEGLLLPYVPSYAAVQAVAMVGAIIMPHNIFLHSALVAERDISRVDPTQSEVKLANRYFLIESTLALLVSFLINLATMVVFAQVFYYPSGVSQTNVGLADAAEALQNVLGNQGKYLWAIGLLAAGQSSTMTGTLAGQYVVEGFWKFTIAPWKRVLATRSLALIPSIMVALLAQNHLDTLGEYLNALQSLQLPFALIPLLALVGDPVVMGRSFVTSPNALRGYYLVALLLLGFNAYLVYNLLAELTSLTLLLTLLLALVGYIYFLVTVIRYSLPDHPSPQ